MAREVEIALANKLRRIAKKVEEWDRRDVEDQIGRGDKRLSRTVYFADLYEIAAMLEGRHSLHKLHVSKPSRGRRARGPNLVERDLEICKIIHQVVEADGFVKNGVELAVATMHVSQKTAEAAWQRYKHVGEDAVLAYFYKLEGMGLAKITRRE